MLSPHAPKDPFCGQTLFAVHEVCFSVISSGYFQLTYQQTQTNFDCIWLGLFRLLFFNNINLGVPLVPLASKYIQYTCKFYCFV